MSTHHTPEQAALIATSLASFRAKASELQARLAIGILYGAGHMILADSPVEGYPGRFITLVLGRFDRPGHYAPNAPRVFCSLDLTTDTLCGVCLYPREDAEANVGKLRADHALTSLVNWRIRHIRAEQERRLVNWREMIAHLERIPT